MISVHQGTKWSYNELLQRSETIASGLLSLGLPKQARVGIYAPNCNEWVATQMACSLTDLILVNINPAYQVTELEYALKKVNISVLIMSPGFKSSNYLQLMSQIAPEIGNNNTNVLNSKNVPSLKHLILIGNDKHKGYSNFDDLYKNNNSMNEYIERSRNINFDDITNIQFTSGTTGESLSNISI